MGEELLNTLGWLVPAGPLAMFFVIVLFTRNNRTLSWMLAWAGVLFSLVLGWIISFSIAGQAIADLKELKKHPLVVESSIPWIPVGSFDAGTWFEIGVAADGLTGVMLFMVPLAVFMIFVYSVGYHNYGKPQGTHRGEPNHGKEEPMFSRFFAYMSLFAGAMLILVMADNLLLLFIGWEIMGFCSYSLIGFWYARDYHLGPDDIPHIPPRKAAVKAFMVTRVADVIMLLGIVFFYRAFGTLNFSEALSAHSLEEAAVLLGPSLGIMALLIFTGTVGKSAQFPLHVWLPDAMEGPTPVSATIHAAAMVSAGIYLLLRIFPLIAVGLETNPAVGWTIAGIGAFTALMAATIAVAQNDVKGVLAYSTISQLGFMVAAVGLGAFVAASFHLITHAFFKALLFLASGSVIHGMEHGAEHVHDHHTDPQDMRYMGGLKDKMPVTYWTFLIGGMALSGLPFITAGFWSKDEIFADAWYVWDHDGKFIGLFVLIMLAVAAFLTAFYTTRQLAMTFAGKPRTPLAEHAHESDNYMTRPLMVLSFFAIFTGFLGIPDKFLGFNLDGINLFKQYVSSGIYNAMEELHEVGLVAHKIQSLPWSWIPLIVSLVVAVGGIAVGYMVYARNPLKEGEEDPLVSRLGGIHTFLQNKWYWDELYQTVFVNPVVYFSEVVVYEYVDKGLIDGTLHLIARTIYAIGAGAKRLEEMVFGDGIDWVKDQFLAVAREMRQLQTGRIQEYALISTSMAGALALIVLAINFGWLQPLFDIFAR